jgi:anti-sigma factor RsiW
MEHSQAVETMAAERYALDEMPPEERNAFEEHYFDCSECAQSVRDTAFVAAGTRSLRVQQSVAAPRRALWAIAAAAALVAVISYQNLVTIPSLRGAGSSVALARVVHPVSFMIAGSRAAQSIEIVTAKGEDVSMYVDVPPEPPWPSYAVEVHDASGKVRATVPVSAAEARESVLITVPGAALTPGHYELVITGSTTEKHQTIARYPFDVRDR